MSKNEMQLIVSCGGDFFSSRLGYVIEGRRMTHSKAVFFLVDKCGMETEEAVSYLSRLTRHFYGIQKGAQ